MWGRRGIYSRLITMKARRIRKSFQSFRDGPSRETKIGFKRKSWGKYSSSAIITKRNPNSLTFQSLKCFDQRYKSM
jgi:hypothetical protein